MPETVKITGKAASVGDTGPIALEFELHVPLRELFAAFALAGLSVGTGHDAERAGKIAYRYADAALAARQESTEDE